MFGKGTLGRRIVTNAAHSFLIGGVCYLIKNAIDNK